MTRKEEIKRQADIQYGDNPCNAAFCFGAEWSDQNPSENQIAMYLGEKGWPLSTYGIPTYEEAAESLSEYYEYKRKQWIDEVCKFLGDADKYHRYDPAGFDTGRLIEDFLEMMKK